MDVEALTKRLRSRALASHNPNELDFEAIRALDALKAERDEAIEGAEAHATALAAEVEKQRTVLRQVRRWIRFDLGDNKTREPWARTLRALDAALEGKAND